MGEHSGGSPPAHAVLVDALARGWARLTAYVASTRKAWQDLILSSVLTSFAAEVAGLDPLGIIAAVTDGALLRNIIFGVLVGTAKSVVTYVIPNRPRSKP